KSLSVNHLGDYQRTNLCTVLQAMEWVRPMFKAHIDGEKFEKILRSGLNDLKRLSNFIGRWEFIGQSPRVLCDSAHNEDGIKKAMEALQKIPFRKLHFVFGTVNDKAPDKVLSMLPKAANYYFAKANIPRGFDAKLLADEAQKHGLVGKFYTSVKRALAAAKRSAQPDDLVFVGGSIFVVAEVI
ncbi:MAG: bifunctional folylpolyglutamate synthase/dihydrofolate synthase, partial [Saprospiraceae bacterium]|nr:bifunctional folylpolyglutamate synthase/dihydrofolate synthase [Saprospiraceae bacterium]